MAHSKLEAIRLIDQASSLLAQAEDDGDLHSTTHPGVAGVEPKIITIRSAVLSSALIALAEAKEQLALQAAHEVLETSAELLSDEPPQHGSLRWSENRWHCYGQPIHAGYGLELKTGETWITVRIESKNRGRILVAYAEMGPLMFKRTIQYSDVLRWPAESTSAKAVLADYEEHAGRSNRLGLPSNT